MPTAPVNAHGAVLYFEDSGKPADNSDYVTLVLGHGGAFHGAGFRYLLPYAKENNLRLVLLNWRDYPGSSRLSPSELDELKGPERERQAGAVRASGLEVLEFLRRFVDTEDVPEIRVGPEGSQTGGIALLGWSAGNIPVLSALAHAGELPQTAKDYLGRYFRSAVLYDPPYVAIGLEAVDDVFEPLFSPGLAPEERAAQFPLWVSSYWTPVEGVIPGHGGARPHPIFPVIQARVVMDDPEKGQSDPAKDYRASIRRVDPDTLATLVDHDVIARSLMPLLHVDPSILAANLDRTLRPASYLSDNADVTWPHLRITHVWCDMSVADCVWAAQYVHDTYLSGAVQRRPLEIYKLQGANHFVHWEDPERFTKFLAGII